MIRILLVLPIVFSIIILNLWRFNPVSNTPRSIKTVRTHVLEAKATHLKRNDLALSEKIHRERNHHDNWMDYLIARSGDRYVDDPAGIVLVYDEIQCPVTLPPGRQFKIAHIGGLINEIEAIFPLEPLSWNEMQEEFTRLINMMASAGWKPSTSRHRPNHPNPEQITLADFASKIGPKWAEAGVWEQCNNRDIKAYLVIKHFNSLSPGSFMPPAALSKPLDDTAEDSFIFLLTFQAEMGTRLESELISLRDARRLHVNGDARSPIPLSVWLDDPDWRPAGWYGEFID